MSSHCRPFALTLFALAVLLAPKPQAQTTVCNGTGPDVIVGALTGPQDYNVSSSMDALAIGTTSCNRGNAPLNWQANNNNHPVIGGELYKYKVVSGSGRFEQIGISWLKHGFFALSESLCCSCSGTTDGSTLGVRCSDPYTASRNGTQSGLGPRWQVNAHTGVFTYPPPHPSSGNNGRIQIPLTDLEASSASVRYFGSGQYVAKDDSAANNDNNNASYREVTAVDDGGSARWNFGFTGITFRETAAIKAWQTCESGVTVSNVQIPSEGLLIVGYKTTNLGGGQWHYEYALYNQNSDASVRTFSVPIASGVTVSNIGFHDITYRGGDGIGGVNHDGTDWTATPPGSSVSWATSTFATNQNANALRWGSTYNFRFDANTPPMGGTLTLGLFKTGGTVTTAIEVPQPGGPPVDSDGDGVNDGVDNCVSVPNTNQLNGDGDFQGDACDTCTDSDNDGFGNPGYPGNTCANDNCPNDSNAAQTDTDGDTAGDACDADDDNDGVTDINDNCPVTVNPGQGNNDFDFLGDACDPDDDNDSVPDGSDNCPFTANLSQLNNDGDSEGDACDADDDNDGVLDGSDNCAFTANPNQANYDGDSMGDACDPDDDDDAVPDVNDGCPLDPLKTSPGVCGCNVDDVDTDSDGLADCVDNCDTASNPGQEDCNGDGIGNVCQLGIAGDCNMNGMPDDCDITGGSSLDQNLDQIPDDCQAAGGISFCFGDGTGQACPCANSGGPGRGCANSNAGSTGAHLVSAGNTSPDTIVLTASGERPAALSIFLQGNIRLLNGVTFGDGRRCAAGDLKRLAAKNAVGGVVSYPTGSAPSVSARSAALGDPLSSGDVRIYQVYYRDPTSTFCPSPSGDTFNATQAVQLIW